MTDHFDNEEYIKRRVDRANEMEGNLKGYDCPKCKNRGYMTIYENGEEKQKTCECMKARKALERIEKSGLKSSLASMRFDNFNASEPWQTEMLSNAKNYVKNGAQAWLFFGGTSGCGKTHLCTAVSGELIKQGKEVRYMMWRDEGTKLKSLVNDSAEYSRMIGELKNVDVLYIDDFFKVQRGQKPTAADINLAYEILNYRYNNKLQTIISSEQTINEIIALDDAVGSRIVELAKGFGQNIAYDKNKNYRLRKA